jgi:hypothetical protein
MGLLSKKTMNFAYGMGAAVVIIGALFKIQHLKNLKIIINILMKYLLKLKLYVGII